MRSHHVPYPLDSVWLHNSTTTIWRVPRSNVGLGTKEERMLMTGLHTVADIFCGSCGGCLGWKYLEAFETRCADWLGEMSFERMYNYKHRLESRAELLLT